VSVTQVQAKKLTIARSKLIGKWRQATTIVSVTSTTALTCSYLDCARCDAYHSYGKQFLFLIEKWLRMNEYQSVHVQSTAVALGFYERLEYRHMPFDDPDGYEGRPEDTAMGKIL